MLCLTPRVGRVTKICIYTVVGFGRIACISAIHTNLQSKPNPMVLHAINLAGAALPTLSRPVRAHGPPLVP
jgi:hypothetical protein